jgi:hypothetical protein
MRLELVRAASRAVIRRPDLWWTALVQLRRLAPDGWWRRAPFLPLPDPEYLRFRLVTMYGDAEHPPDVEALRTYFEWCRAFPKPPARPHGRDETAPARSGGTR